MMDKLRGMLGISRYQLRIFVLTFLTTFSIVALQLLGVNVSRLISPLQTVKEDTLTSLLPKLEYKKNTYSLQKVPVFIAKAYAASEADEASAYAVIDFDSGNVLFEKNSQTRVPIASLTKIMTAIVALDLATPQEEFVVTENASEEIPTKIGVVPGEKMTLQELLQAALLTSANDAVEVIREGIDQKYSERLFVKAMNKKAEIINLKNTHFENPQGFDGEGHYSSAEDLAVLSHYAVSQYPLLAEIVKDDYEFLPENIKHKQFDLYNWNGLIDVYPNVSGIKIGNTDAAKKTTVVVAEREGKKILVVLLGAPGILERDLWAAQLLDMGFEKTLGLPPIRVTEEQLRVKYATWK